MKILFTYNENKGIECLLRKGGGSNNQPGKKTKTYEELLKFTPEINNVEKVREFIRTYLHDNNVDIQKTIVILQSNWNMIGNEFEKCAERVFGLNMPDQITAYMTITGRYPYSIEDKYFYVSAQKTNANATVMHELWHFYTWYKFGESERINPKKYNDFKEALAVLLNIECPDLMGEAVDGGYPQHAYLRTELIEEWKKSKDINKVWSMLQTRPD